MRDSFLLAWRRAWRGKAAWILLAVVVAAHWLLPGFVRSDGTQAGVFEMHVRLIAGFAAAAVYLFALVSSCGAFAGEREDDTLSLALVRPVPAFSVAAGKWLAIVAVSACALALNVALTTAFPPLAEGAPPCRRHYAPALPPPEVSAAAAMEVFLKNDKTPEQVKRASRTAVLALLTAKENERYEVVRPGEKVSWPFNVSADVRLSVKTRFSTMYNLKSDLNGVFRFSSLCGIVSNNTQAVVEVPLTVSAEKIPHGELVFENTGKNDVMLRPRRDIELLAPGFPFAENCARAMIQSLSLVGMLAAFGLFLSASLSRPVAIFTASVMMLASLMAPDAISQFPDEFNATAGEKAGLAISRMVAWATAPFAGTSPVSDLAASKAVSSRELCDAALSGFMAWPMVLLPLTAFVLRRKNR
jgi:ABC-type transport system involved in multi-copper enzyme maturation permease subunit